MENLTVSLNLAKRLKDAGFSQTTIFHWWLKPTTQAWKITESRQSTTIAAATAQELLDKLPDEYTKEGMTLSGDLQITKDVKNGTVTAGYYCGSNWWVETCGPNLAEVLALLILKIGVDKIIEPQLQ